MADESADELNEALHAAKLAILKKMSAEIHRYNASTMAEYARAYALLSGAPTAKEAESLQMYVV